MMKINILVPNVRVMLRFLITLFLILTYFTKKTSIPSSTLPPLNNTAQKSYKVVLDKQRLKKPLGIRLPPPSPPLPVLCTPYGFVLCCSRWVLDGEFGQLSPSYDTMHSRNLTPLIPTSTPTVTVVSWTKNSKIQNTCTNSTIPRELPSHPRTSAGTSTAPTIKLVDN
ncbi:hypothetical protein HOY80DRAFT_48857 [Tuber brumale]|nr:hypothetical protein HOY80DRAFT_48857 [Tuber brumale]